MDGQHGDTGFTEDEKIKIGRQQAAMIQMQNVQQQQMMMQRQEEQDLMDAQQKALHFKMDQDRQKLAEQQSMMLRSMEEQKKEEELARLQQIALMERQKEQMQMPPGPGGPPMPPIPPLGVPSQQSQPGGSGVQMVRPVQQIGAVPQMGGPNPQLVQPQQLAGPGQPQQMGGPPQQMGGPLPQQRTGPPTQQMAPQQMGGPPQTMGGPPPQMGGSQQQMGGPPQQMSGPPQQMGGPPQQIRSQQQFSGPPQQLGGTQQPQQQQRVGFQQPVGGPQQMQMGGPQQMRGPIDQMGGPQRGGPPDSQRMGNQQQMGGPNRDAIPSLMSGNIAPVSQGQKGQFAPNTSQMQRPNVQGSGPPQGQFNAPSQGPSRTQQPEGPRGMAPPGGRPSDGQPPALMQMETHPPKKEAEDEEIRDIKNDEEFKLPPALEKVLAFKNARVQEVGVKPEEMERIEQGELVEEEEAMREEQERLQRQEQQQQQIAEDEDDEEEEPVQQSNKKESKNKKRKKKKKRAKQRNAQKVPTIPDSEPKDDVEIEYVQEELEMDRTDPSYREFSKIFEAFKIAEPEVPIVESKQEAPKETPKEKPPKEFGQESSDEDSDEGEKKPQTEDDKVKLSKKKQKKLNRLSVAELKQLVTRPDVVEMHDVTARDPKLLVHLKATKNTVPVPRHWCFKRKYLQGKRGIEKLPFDLPDFIKNTGIMEMRQALQDKEDAKNLKAKMREKVRPKMGKIDIDYQKLHDAFFKYQTKPKMTIHGDLYYEGKEFETKLKEKKPGDLTDDLRTALGMPLGPNADKYPPPWLIAMQRYGPPPSYPNLKISGLNAPIPENCSFGYHAGGWGKPPVDESGKPLYGDVFGQSLAELPVAKEDEEIDKTLWGELESESEDEESEEEDSDEEKEEADNSGLVTPGDPGLASVTPSGTTSVPIGVETPDMIELRKKRIEDAMDQGGDTPALYQVLKEKSAAVGGSMMGSAHVYDLPAAGAQALAAGKKADGVDVALNPDELDLDTAAIQAKYEQQLREQQSQLEKEDLSDMVADHAAKQAKKRKKQQQDTSKSAKKYKDFKF